MLRNTVKSFSKIKPGSVCFNSRYYISMTNNLLNGLGDDSEYYNTLKESEKNVYNKLKENFDPTFLEVMDSSDGCAGGNLFIDIHSKKFEGQTMLKQNRMVNSVLKDEIKNYHAVRIRPEVSKD
eukprot:TRINITY_DN3204_c0_g2_i2.p1 TRINITY_DN3204_c0_g2~~TRINITY_DN3204_c0_g2_i2.p1  ORF type:complete len:124 (-),score=27.53 TRINITY_DN3204_c0_g2_i2:583-954(-)